MGRELLRIVFAAVVVRLCSVLFSATECAPSRCFFCCCWLLQAILYVYSINPSTQQRPTSAIHVVVGVAVWLWPSFHGDNRFGNCQSNNKTNVNVYYEVVRGLKVKLGIPVVSQLHQCRALSPWYIHCGPFYFRRPFPSASHFPSILTLEIIFRPHFLAVTRSIEAVILVRRNTVNKDGIAWLPKQCAVEKIKVIWHN